MFCIIQYIGVDPVDLPSVEPRTPELEPGIVDVILYLAYRYAEEGRYLPCGASVVVGQDERRLPPVADFELFEGLAIAAVVVAQADYHDVAWHGKMRACKYNVLIF